MVRAGLKARYLNHLRQNVVRNLDARGADACQSDLCLSTFVGHDSFFAGARFRTLGKAAAESLPEEVAICALVVGTFCPNVCNERPPMLVELLRKESPH